MNVLASTFLAKLFVDTIGSLDPFGGKVYLPSPRAYLATLLLWGLLGVVAGFGQGAARLAGRLALLVLLTAAVLGPFGKKFVSFLEAAAHYTAPQEGTP